MFKRIISGVTVAAITLSVSGIKTFAENTNTIYTEGYYNSFSNKEDIIPDSVHELALYEKMGKVKAVHSLLDYNDEVIAYCVDYSNAYIIYDINKDIVEYSESNPSPLENIKKERIYYSGPLSYCYEKNGILKNTVSNVDLSKSQFIKTSKEFSKKLQLKRTVASNADDDIFPYVGNLSSDSLLSDTEEIVNISGNSLIKRKTVLKNKPRCLKYYTDKYCGCVATTELLFYYHDHIKSGYLKKEYADDTGKTYSFLKDSYIPKMASYANMRDGINNACSKICKHNIFEACIYNSDLNVENVKKTWGGVYYKIRNNKSPVIILTQGDPAYKDHWATCYGVIIYYTSKGKVKLRQYVVDDSMGRNNIKIRCSHVDGFIYLN